MCASDTRTRVGKIFFCSGSLDELWEWYGRELTGVI